MSKSHILISMILKNEGGYAYIKADSGGETYQGISRTNFPKWEGWKIIDKYKPLKRGQIITTVQELQDLVESFYKTNFYDRCKIDSINNVFISAHVLDHSVNCGVSPGVKCIQRALSNLGYSISIDGKIGPITIRTINQANSSDLLNEVISERKKYYNLIVDKNPTQKKFLAGWLNRIDEVNTYISNKFKS